MTKPKLIEKLGDLATFLTLAASDADKERERECRLDASGRLAAFYEGKSNAYNIAFTKLDVIVKEAKE